MKNNLIGQKFNFLYILEDNIIKFSKSNYKRFYCKCKCDCGKIVFVEKVSVKRNHTKSCGCHRIKQNKKSLKKSILGKIFGYLTVIEEDVNIRKTKSNYYKYLIKCKCSCGNEKIIDRNSLVTGNTKTCGNCKKMKNGRLYSFIQDKLLFKVGKGILNFKSKNKCIDIALVYNGKKIGIEYDSWRWHKERLEKDKEKILFLNKNNWYILSIKSDGLLPTTKEIWEKINKLNDNNFYEEIIMEDWNIKNRKRNFK